MDVLYHVIKAPNTLMILLYPLRRLFLDFTDSFYAFLWRSRDFARPRSPYIGNTLTFNISLCISETWLREHIHDNVVDVFGYNLTRQDRTEGQHGGVCIYIKNSIQFQILNDLMDSDFEVIWAQIRPTRLPRGIPIA